MENISIIGLKSVEQSCFSGVVQFILKGERLIMDKKLYRSNNDRVFAGVCGGLGEYFAVDTVVIRLLWVVFTVMGGAGLIAYIIAAIIVPLNPVSGNIDGMHPGSAQQNGPEYKSNNGRSSMIFGIFLLIFGGFVLVKNFLPWISGDVFLAAFLILLGVFFIVRKNS